MARTSSFLGGQWQTNPERLPALFVNYLLLWNGAHIFGTGDGSGQNSSTTNYFSRSMREYITNAADATQMTLCNVSGGGGWLTSIVTQMFDTVGAGGTVALEYTIDGAAAVTYTWTSTGTNHSQDRLVIGAIDGARTADHVVFEDYPVVNTTNNIMLPASHVAIQQNPLACLRFESSCVVKCTMSDVESAAHITAGPYAGSRYILDVDLQGA